MQHLIKRLLIALSLLIIFASNIYADKYITSDKFSDIKNLIHKHQYSEAIKKAKSQLKEYPSNSIEYALLLSFQAESYTKMMELQKAGELFNQSMSIAEKCDNTTLFAQYEIAYKITELELLFTTSFDKHKVENNNFGKLINHLNNELEEPINKDYTLQADSLLDIHMWKFSYHKTLVMFNLASFAYTEEYVEDAIKLTKEAEILFGKWSKEHIESSILLGQCYETIMQYEEALKLYKEVQSIYIEKYGENSIENGEISSIIGSISVNLGDYKNAQKALNNTISIFEKHKIASKYYINALELTAIIHATEGDKESAINILDRVVQLCSNIYGSQSAATLKVMLNQAAIYLELEEYGKMKQIINYVDKYSNNLKVEDHTNLIYLDIRHFIKNKEYNYALMLLNIMLNDENMSQSVNISHQKLNIYNDMAQCCLFTGEYNDAYKWYNTYLNELRKGMKETFVFMSEAQRENYWQKQNNTLNSILQINHPHTTYHKDSGIPKATKERWNEKSEILYNAALLQKGILLEASRNIMEIVTESGNTQLYNKLKRLQEIRMQLNSQNREGINYEELENEAQKLEEDLLASSRQYANYMKYLDITWQDIHKSLSEHDVAIEFISSNKEGRTYYSAEILKSNFEKPIHIQLFSLSNETKWNIDFYDKDMIVWPKILPYLNGAKNIYFAASGDLHKLAIEYMMIDESKRINELYNIYRLSSTRQLAINRESKTTKSATLWGGMNYNLDIEEMEYYASASTTRGSSLWHYLPGTQNEVEQITKLLDSTDIIAQLYTGDKGIEESFKIQSSNSSDILHIATHGFYITDQKSEKLSDWASHTLQIDKAMSQSGLVFSGANNSLLMNESLILNTDDGILKASEIATMDLSKTDLVVLSACQTGQGEITGEGVFGLQRAFKKAGVGTILMSLQEVDDTATEILMTNFYKEYISGKSKHEALRLAQLKVIEQRGANPDYWASFILLD